MNASPSAPPSPASVNLAEVRARLDGLAPEALARGALEWALDAFRGRIAIASSMSIEDAVVIDLATRIDKNVCVFALDTGRLPEETYLTAEALREKYRLEITWYFPERAAVEALEREKGLYSFMASLENRHECCGIRKVAPLNRALATLSAWVTGLRREQAITRADLETIEIDDAHGDMVKINPLATWTEAAVFDYARRHRVPIHPLHDRGYPSIGCAPCTRAIQPGEHPRAGRWWWEHPETKECGLHTSPDGKPIGGRGPSLLAR